MTTVKPSLFLDSEELAELTNKSRNSAQARVLKAMGIDHKIRPDGSVAVLRAHVEKLFGLVQQVRTKKVQEPNWNAL